MDTFRNANKIGIYFISIVFLFCVTNAWAVVPYLLSPEIEKADKIEAQKQEIIRRLTALKKQDANAIQEIRDYMNQMEEKDCDALSQDKPCKERH